MLTGQLPFRRTEDMNSNLQLVHLIVSQMPPTPRDILPTVPLILSDIIMKCLQKNPDARYQSMLGLLVDLRSARDLLIHVGVLPPSTSSSTIISFSSGNGAALLARADTHTFELGVYDTCAIFRPSKKLYGRGGEVAELMQSFERMMQTGRSHVAFVRGLPGSGKSRLIQHVFSTVLVQRQVLYVSAKLEEYSRQPFACIKEVVNQVLLHFLTLSSAQLSEWRTKILQLCAGNGALMIQLFPVLGQILGPQPQVQELPAQETAARLTHLLTHFLCSFATPNRPVVLFFDDIQWADRFSLEAIESLVKHPSCAHTLVLLSARVQDVTRTAQLDSMLRRIQEANVPLVSLLMAPLELDTINEFVSDTLHCSLYKALALSHFILTQSHGSPLFVQQIMQALHRDGLLRFHFELKDLPTSKPALPSAGSSVEPNDEHGMTMHAFIGEWRYDLKSIAAYFSSLDIVRPPATLPPAVSTSTDPASPPDANAAGISSAATNSTSPDPAISSTAAAGEPTSPILADAHMIVFLQRHVLQLPEIGQRVLKAASCIGLEFSFALLVEVLHPLPAMEVYYALQRPLSEELIQRVQTAAQEAAGLQLAATTLALASSEEMSKTRSSVKSKSSLLALPPAAPATTSSILRSRVASDGPHPSPSRPSLLSGSSNKALAVGYDSDGGSRTRGSVQFHEDDTFAGTWLPLPADVKRATTGGVQLLVSQMLRDPDCKFSFLHDKIHESVYTLLPVDDRAELHLRIADLLLAPHRAEIAGQIQTLLHSVMDVSVHLQHAKKKATDLQQKSEQQQMATRGAVGGVVADAQGLPRLPPVEKEQPRGMTDAAYFQVSNHYIKSIHLIAEHDTLRRPSASLLLLAADKAKSMGSYITALYFVKNAMFLMRLEKAATLSENSRTSSRSRTADSKGA